MCGSGSSGGAYSSGRSGDVVKIDELSDICQHFLLICWQIKAGMVKPFFVCKFTFRLQPAMLPVVFVVRMLSPPALEHRSPMKQPHFVSILCFFASIAFHVNP